MIDLVRVQWSSQDATKEKKIVTLGQLLFPNSRGKVISDP